VGLGRRIVRKSVRRATPRPVRKAMHPARTARNAITPRPVKQVSRAAYTVRHPVGAAENKAIGAVLCPPRPRRRTRRRTHSTNSSGCLVLLVLATVLGLVATYPWYCLGLGVAAVVVLVVARRRARRMQPPVTRPPAAVHQAPLPTPPATPWPVPPSAQPAARVVRATNQPGSAPPSGYLPQPWPADRAFRVARPDLPAHPPFPDSRPPQSAGEAELQPRLDGWGDGRHLKP
jgi:hypothetical protein